MKRCLLVYLLVFMVGAASGTSVTRMIYRVHPHEHPLELGVLELYCAQQPDVAVNTIVTPDGREIMELGFAHLEMKPDMIQKVEAIKGDGFAVHTGANRNGRTITITYDPRSVSVIHGPIVSIGMEHGISVRFINQQLLRTMENHEKPILSVAYLQ